MLSNLMFMRSPPYPFQCIACQRDESVARFWRNTAAIGIGRPVYHFAIKPVFLALGPSYILRLDPTCQRHFWRHLVRLPVERTRPYPINRPVLVRGPPLAIALRLAVIH